MKFYKGVRVMILKGIFKVDEGNIGLAMQILQSEGFSVEESNNTLYIYEEVNPLEFNRTKAIKIIEKLQEIGVKDCEIKAYSEVPIYHYFLKEGSFVERLK